MGAWGDLLSWADQTVWERLNQILGNSVGRWHRRADEPHQIVYVLDDGTGDVELRFVPEAPTSTESTRFAVQLLSASNPVADTALNLSSNQTESAAEGKFHDWLAQAIRQIGRDSDNAASPRNHERFMVAFEPSQLEALRKLAVQRNIPVAEIVRQAVARYLTEQSDTPTDDPPPRRQE